MINDLPIRTWGTLGLRSLAVEGKKAHAGLLKQSEGVISEHQAKLDPKLAQKTPRSGGPSQALQIDLLLAVLSCETARLELVNAPRGGRQCFHNEVSRCVEEIEKLPPSMAKQDYQKGALSTRFGSAKHAKGLEALVRQLCPVVVDF